MITRASVRRPMRPNGVPVQIGIPCESLSGETRVAATPATVKQLRSLGYDVVVACGAGAASSFPDEAYAEAGARLVPDEEAWLADVVLRVNGPTLEEADR